MHYTTVSAAVVALAMAGSLQTAAAAPTGALQRRELSDSVADLTDAGESLDKRAAPRYRPSMRPGPQGLDIMAIVDGIIAIKDLIEEGSSTKGQAVALPAMPANGVKARDLEQVEALSAADNELRGFRMPIRLPKIKPSKPNKPNKPSTPTKPKQPKVSVKPNAQPKPQSKPQPKSQPNAQAKQKPQPVPSSGFNPGQVLEQATRLAQAIKDAADAHNAASQSAPALPATTTPEGTEEPETPETTDDDAEHGNDAQVPAEPLQARALRLPGMPNRGRFRGRTGGRSSSLGNLLGGLLDTLDAANSNDQDSNM